MAQNTLLHGFSYTKKAILLIAVFTIFRGVIAFTMELGGDEAYYWFYSLNIKLNYFDHPPMIAFWIRLFTINLSLQNVEGFIRLGSLVGCALSSWFIFKTCCLLHSERAGLFGVCLYNVSFYAAVTAGIFAMPDSPQMVFYTLCILLIAKISRDENKWSNWILFGIAAGLCIMSKVHGVFIWVGLGLYVLLFKRSLLRKPQLYIALLLTFIISSPILFWNLKYNFATYRFHSNRVTVNGGGINVLSFLREIISHLFFNNPFNVLVIITALVAYIKDKTKRLQALTIYNFMAIPLAVILIVISLFRDTTLPHWNGPAYVALVPLASIWLANRAVSSFPKIIYAGITGFVVFLIAWQSFLYLYPGPYGSKNQFDLGRGDVTLDKYGRKKAGKQFAELYKSEVKRGIMPVDAPVVYYKWWAAHIEYYFCRASGIPMIGLGNLENLHEYMWMNGLRKDKVNFSSAYCITPSEDRDDMDEHYLPYYSKIDAISVIRCFRGNKPVRDFYIYRLTGWKNRLPFIR